MRMKGHEHVRQPQHTPAHRTIEQIRLLPAAERRIALGNRHVDLQAKDGLKHHEGFPEAFEKDFAAELQRIRFTARTLSATLRLFEPIKYGRRLKQYERKQRRLLQETWHSWHSEGGIRRCSTCLRITNAPEDELVMTGCPGVPAPLRRIAKWSFAGHKLQSCDFGERQLFFCVLCGAWAMKRCLNLAEPCKQHALPGSASATVLRRIAQGRRPDTGERTLTIPVRRPALEESSEIASQLAKRPRLCQPSLGSPLEGVYRRVRDRESAAMEARSRL